MLDYSVHNFPMVKGLFKNRLTPNFPRRSTPKNRENIDKDTQRKAAASSTEATESGQEAEAAVAEAETAQGTAQEKKELEAKKRD